MTVYVDELHQYGNKFWCHMWAEDVQELHNMAKKIGMKFEWFQNHLDHPHYDLQRKKRELAIFHGAVEVSSVELVEMIREARIRKHNE